MGRTSDANERLMDAALDLIWEESYGAVTIDDICKRAGVKKGSFYYFFQSKADLAVAALERMWREESKPALDACFSSSIDPVARIANHLTAIYESQAKIKCEGGQVLGCPICSVGSEISTHESDLCAKVRELVGRKRRYLETAIRDAVAEGLVEPCEPAQKALALTALIDGFMSQARILNDPEIMRSLPAMGLELLRVKKPAPAATAAPVTS